MWSEVLLSLRRKICSKNYFHRFLPNKFISQKQTTINKLPLLKHLIDKYSLYSSTTKCWRIYWQVVNKKIKRIRKSKKPINKLLLSWEELSSKYKTKINPKMLFMIQEATRLGKLICKTNRKIEVAIKSLVEWQTKYKY